MGTMEEDNGLGTREPWLRDHCMDVRVTIQWRTPRLADDRRDGRRLPANSVPDTVVGRRTRLPCDQTVKEPLVADAKAPVSMAFKPANSADGGAAPTHHSEASSHEARHRAHLRRTTPGLLVRSALSSRRHLVKPCRPRATSLWTSPVSFRRSSRASSMVRRPSLIRAPR